MRTLFLTLRAIGTDFAMRLYIPLAATAITVLVILIALNLWLTTLSQWWWLLIIPITILASVGMAIFAVIFMLIRYVRPSQTKAQKLAVKRFVDKMQSAADIAATPKIIILLRVVRSIAAPSKDSYLQKIVENRQLVEDFRNLQQSFTLDTLDM